MSTGARSRIRAMLLALCWLCAGCSFDARNTALAAPGDGHGATDARVEPEDGGDVAPVTPETSALDTAADGDAALSCVTVQDCVALTSAAPACHHVVCREGACDITPSPDATPCQDPALNPGPCERPRCDGDGRCVLRLRPPDSPCDDGVDCTVDDRCDGAGQCVGDGTDCP
jgi:hypothetical protein